MIAEVQRFSCSSSTLSRREVQWRRDRGNAAAATSKRNGRRRSACSRTRFINARN